MPDAKPTRKDRRLTKEQIIMVLQAAARKLGRAPTSVELRQLSNITVRQVAGRFQTYRAAVLAAGLIPGQMGLRVEKAALLEDWAQVVRKVGAVPSREEYKEAGRYSWHCFTRCFQRWSGVPAAFCRFVAAGGLAGDWSDVLDKIWQGPMPFGGVRGVLAKRREAVRAAYAAQAAAFAAVSQSLAPQRAGTNQPVATTEPRQHQAHSAVAQVLPPPLVGKKCVTATMLAVFVADVAPSAFSWITAACFPRRVLQDRPLLGAPTQFPGLAYEPVNEMGVMMLFAMLSRQLGFVIESVQAGFPDCHVKIEVEPGRWQDLRIEFEYESRNFQEHGHDPQKCDLIVCWRHNWKNCPPNLQVLELSKIVKSFTN